MKTVDYIIVGQGIAGTNMAHRALSSGKSILVIDQPQANSATKVSAGIINPITGRKFVKSWLTDTLLPIAFETYQELSDLLSIPIFKSKHIIRSFSNSKDENNWEVRASVPSFQKYVHDTVDLGIYENIIHKAYGYGEVKGGGHIAINELLDAYSDFLKKENLLLVEPFDFSALRMETDSVFYKSIQAKKIIFCEGMGIKHNPFFNYLPVQGNKGEVLMIRIPNVEAPKLIKQGIFLVPFGNETYWAGSDYTIHFDDDQPSEAGRATLIRKVNAILNVPYEILEHRAAIRPTVPNRRPLIGVHPTFKNLVLFNGMGTKGASLSPYCAQQLFDHLEHEATLNDHIDIDRYVHFLEKNNEEG